MIPGETTFTRTWGPQSTASERVRLTTPARAAPECAMVAAPRCQMLATMFTIAPPSPAARSGWSAWHMFQVPVRLVSMTARQPFGVMSSARAMNCPPAQFTSASHSSSEPTSSATFSRSRTSAANVSQPTASSFSWSRPTAITRRPSSISTRQIAAPISAEIVADFFSAARAEERQEVDDLIHERDGSDRRQRQQSCDPRARGSTDSRAPTRRSRRQSRRRARSYRCPT